MSDLSSEVLPSHAGTRPSPGIEATDAMRRRRPWTAAHDHRACGKYLVVVGGNVADESSLRAGWRCGNTVLDQFLIQNVHPAPPAIKGRRWPRSRRGHHRDQGGRLRHLRRRRGREGAKVELIEARNQPGAKGMVVLTSEVGAVRAVVAAGVASIKKEGC
jgi:microcompartment protein CcmL/EutN